MKQNADRQTRRKKREKKGHFEKDTIGSKYKKRNKETKIQTKNSVSRA